MSAAGAGDARAALFSVGLDYQVVAGCPDVTEFESLVQARLGYDPFSDRSPNHALVKITRHDDALTGTIEWRDSTGGWLGDQVVPLASADCHRLARTVALALTVQIRLLASAEDTNAGTAVPANTAPTVEAVSTKPPPPLPAPVAAPVVRARGDEPRPSTREPWPRFDVRAGSAVGFGMSSDPVFLGRVLGSIGWQHVSLELAGEVSLPTTTHRADGAAFSQRHLLASIAACAPRGRWSACLVTKAGESRMAGENIDRPTSAVVPIVEAGARVGVVQDLGWRVFLAAHADALANITRWTGELDHIPVWTAPRFAAVLGIDVGVALP